MRINNQNGFEGPAPTKSGQVGGVQPSQRPNRGADSAPVAPGSDSVSLSKLVSKVSQSFQADSSSRSLRVSQIAEAVQSGTYQVDSLAVSRSLIDQAISSGGGPRD